jgi:hypothetical protein
MTQIQHITSSLRLWRQEEMENEQQQQEQQHRVKRSLEDLANEESATATSLENESMKQYVLSYDSTDSETHSDESDDDNDDDDIDEEAETAVAQALVRAAMRRTLSMPSLLKLIGSQRAEGPALKKARVQTTTSPTAQRAEPPSLNLCRQKSVSVMSLSPQTPSSSRKQGSIQVNNTFDIKPEDFLKSLLMYKGVEFKTFAALELGDKFFVPVTPEAVAAYDMDVVKDIRNADVEALRAKKDSGRLLQVCNKFGESVVHTVARRGSSLHVLKFLMEEANVSCQVCCDSGRTPLADACWTSNPNFELIGYLLDKCPDLLYITDSRGFTPLAYASREHFGAWCKFLKERSLDGLLPRQLK